MSEGKVESPAEISPSIPEHRPQQYETVTYQHTESYPHPSDQHLALVHRTPSLIPNSGHQARIATQTYSVHNQFFQPASEHHSIETISPEISSYPTTSPTNAGTEFSQPMAQFEGYLPAGYDFMPTNTAPRIVGMVEGGVDWLNMEFESPNNGDLQAQYQSAAIQSLYPQPPIATGLEEAFQNRVQQAISGQLMPIRSQEPNGSSVKISEPPGATQQWPFDHAPNPEAQKCRLPPLRDILRGAPIQNEPDNGAILKSLIQLMSSAYLPEVDTSQDVNMASAMDLLKNSLDLYFAEFHAVLPLVHIPTFHMNKVPTVTLAAMACIGAMYSDDQKGTEQSWSLSEICIQMIAFLVSRIRIDSTRSLTICNREMETPRISTTHLL